MCRKTPIRVFRSPIFTWARKLGAIERSFTGSLARVLRRARHVFLFLCFPEFAPLFDCLLFRGPLCFSTKQAKNNYRFLPGSSFQPSLDFPVFSRGFAFNIDLTCRSLLPRLVDGRSLRRPKRIPDSRQRSSPLRGRVKQCSLSVRVSRLDRLDLASIFFSSAVGVPSKSTSPKENRSWKT